jgi:KDO2-lipid IV(A) lauroyltransferase
MKTKVNTVGIFFLKALSYLPFWFLYGLSDILAITLLYVMKYRKKVVLTNLRLSFPEKGEKEISEITGKFYRHLADIILETIKGYSMSWERFAKRITFHGIEKMNGYYDEGKSIVLLGMHYNNWEWSVTSQRLMKHESLLLYDPVRGNPQFEEYLLYIRERWGAKYIPVHKSARIVLEFHNRKIPAALGLGADQRPAAITRLWTIFLNQEACFVPGPEKIVRKANMPVFFLLIRKISRGHYEMSYIPLIENPAEMTEEEIMLTYIRTMEKYIREKPEYYLWSHRRWKQKRPADYPLLYNTGNIGS